MKVQGPVVIIILVVRLLAAPLFAQDAPAPVATAPAATDDAAAPAEYGGPAILSRGGATSLRTPAQNFRIRPYLSLSGSYDTGLTPVVISPQGRIPDEASAGGEIEVGVLGYHNWKKTTVGLDYRGNYRHYAHNTYYNGTDQVLSLIFKRQQSRRVEFTLRESAGLYSRAFFVNEPLDLTNPNFANIPTNQIFDNRTLFFGTNADVTFHKTARLSFDFGGDAFLVRRRSSALAGVTGEVARADVAYRTSRFATTGAAYTFTHYGFTRGFGASDVHTILLTQSIRLGRSWELAMKAGGARVETLALAAVAVDPVIASITGQATGVEAVYRVNWVPSGEVSLRRAFRRASLSFDASSGVNPGNGVFLTSRYNAASTSLSYSGIRRWNLGVSGGYATLSSLSQSLSRYSAYNGGAGATYKISGALHALCRYDYRRYDIEQTLLKRNSYRVSIGFGFSPGDIPLSLW